MFEVMAEAMLEDPRYRISDPEWRAKFLRRFLELLRKERARRPAHRPREVSAGETVALLHSCGKSEQAAIRLVTKMRNVQRATVERSYRQYKQQRGGK